MARVGIGYIGTSQLMTSTSNLELVPSPSASWNVGYKLYRFSFLNDQDCTVIVNGVTTLFIRASQGFEINEPDAPITSFVIVTAGINYNFVAGY